MKLFKLPFLLKLFLFFILFSIGFLVLLWFGNEKFSLGYFGGLFLVFLGAVLIKKR